MANYYLMHHGVKGMKWGQRKALRKAEKQAARAARTARTAGTETQDAKQAAVKNTRTKGQRMALRIIGGVGTDIGIGMMTASAQSLLRDAGHDAVASMLGYAATGASIANIISTVSDSVKIGKDKRDRW